MADVTLTYKENTIVELNTTGNKTIKTAGKYCEDDISITYTGGRCPRAEQTSVISMADFLNIYQLTAEVVEIIS